MASSSVKIFMNVEILSYRRRLIDEILQAEPYENSRKLINPGQIYREFHTSELHNPSIQAPLSVVPGFTEDAINRNWAYTDFFPPKKYLCAAGTYRYKDKTSPFLNVTVNKTGQKGAPYVMYSSNLTDYVVRKERTVNNTDTSIRISRKIRPTSIGLYKNTALFLETDALDIINCTTSSTYRIEVKNSVGLAVPEKDISSIPVLRDMEGSKTISTKKMYLDRVDMATGKIDNYILQCSSTYHKYRIICNTWHPMQYVCVCSDKASLVDLREKSSRLFWDTTQPKKKIPDVFRPHHKAEKGKDSKIHITQTNSIGTFDMRNLGSVFGETDTGIRSPILSVGRHIAAYSTQGIFFFQNPLVPEDRIIKTYQFSPDDAFLGFDWTGKSNSTPYSIAAFMFDNKISIYYGDGTIAIHNIPKSIWTSRKKRSINSRPNKISKNKEEIPSIISKPIISKNIKNLRNLFTPSEIGSPTVLERTMQDGFRDPLNPAEEFTVEIPEPVKKTIQYTKIIDLLPVQERNRILQETKIEKSKKEGE